MASLAPASDKNWACTNGGDELGVLDVNTINGAFLMSLMEELQDHDVVEEKDEERLNSVIRSLEAELKDSCTIMAVDAHQHRSSSEHDHDHQSSSDGEDSQMDGQDSSIISFDDLDQMNGWDFNIMEVDEPCSPTYSSGDDVNCYVYHCGDEKIISSSNYGDHNYYYGVVLDQDNGYNSFWQETVYDSVITNNNNALF